MSNLLQNMASSSHVGELNDWNLYLISPPTITVCILFNKKVSSNKI